MLFTFETFYTFLKKGLAIYISVCYYMQARQQTLYAPVAQLDRVTDYESVGRGFESLPAYHNEDTIILRTPMFGW